MAQEWEAPAPKVRIALEAGQVMEVTPEARPPGWAAARAKVVKRTLK